MIRRKDTSLLPVARNIEILAPTLLEYWAVRCTFPKARASWAGVGLTRWKDISQGTVVVVCGLAGALASGLSPGSILIPDRVGLADGRTMHCDPVLVEALVTAARTLHLQLNTGPLLTAQSLIVGCERLHWAQQGFVAVDMETGLLAGRGLRVATLRVVLDGPEHDISLDWLRPMGAVLQPPFWRELFWLSWVAPRYALRAAQVLKVGFDTGAESIFSE